MIVSAELVLLDPIPGITDVANAVHYTLDREHMKEDLPGLIPSTSGLNPLLAQFANPRIGLTIQADETESLTVKVGTSRGGAITEHPPVEVTIGALPETVDLTHVFTPWPAEGDGTAITITDARSVHCMTF